MPMRNAAPWLSEALESLLTQSYDGPMELTVFNDGSSVSCSNLYTWEPRTVSINSVQCILSYMAMYCNGSV